MIGLAGFTTTHQGRPRLPIPQAAPAPSSRARGRARRRATPARRLSIGADAVRASASTRFRPAAFPRSPQELQAGTAAVWAANEARGTVSSVLKRVPLDIRARYG